MSDIEEDMDAFCDEAGVSLGSEEFEADLWAKTGEIIEQMGARFKSLDWVKAISPVEESADSAPFYEQPYLEISLAEGIDPEAYYKLYHALSYLGYPPYSVEKCEDGQGECLQVTSDSPGLRASENTDLTKVRVPVFDEEDLATAADKLYQNIKTIYTEETRAAAYIVATTEVNRFCLSTGDAQNFIEEQKGNNIDGSDGELLKAKEDICFL
jgi:hypothetical protein